MNEKLRAAAQAALEALETLMLERDCIYRRAINSLKAALAEPAIKESLTGAEQEPVAWKHPDKNMVFWEDTKKVDEYHGFKLTIPLYASPPAAQPEPTCPECKAAVLYECVACSNNNYPPRPEQEPVAREGFEKWAKSLPNYMDISRFETGYSDCNIDYAWAGWQAALAQPEQEPVLWMSDKGSVASMQEKKMGYVLDGIFNIPLYTTPPAAQHEWVGLTEEEIDYQAKKDDHGVYFALGALWAQAKLKERNT